MSWWNAVAAPARSVGSAAANGAKAAGTGMDWSSLIEPALKIGSSLAGGYFANQGVNKAADAQTAANQAAIDLQRGIYNDQTARSEPWRKSGFNALNFQNQWLGMPQVSDMGAGGVGGGSGGAGLLPNLGAGQPVPGHSGGGGPNALTGAVGSGIGGFFGGPIGAGIGQAIGGLVRNGGDNWQTLATQAPGGFDYNAYMQQPDLQAEWAKPDVQSLFGGNQDAYANWHYNKFGKNEGRTLNPTAAPAADGGAGGAGGATQTAGTPDLWSTIKNNPLYVAATQGFLGIDKPQVDGAFSQAGQALSGAQSKALFDRGTARSYGALSDIYNQYAGMSDTGGVTANQQNANAGQFGANAGNIMMNNGQIAGNAAAAKNANWMNAGANALSGAYGAAKKQGWIT